MVDQHPVGALGSCGAYPPFGVTVGSWRPRWGLGYLHALASEDLIERAGELGVAVPDEEAEGAGRSPRSVSRLRACWRSRSRPGGRFRPRMCPRRVATSMTNSTYRCLRKIVLTWRSRWPAALAPERWNVRQAVSAFGGAGLRRRARKIRRTVASLIWWPSRDSSPWIGGIPGPGFLGQSQHQVADVLAGPLAGDWFWYVHLCLIRRRCQASSVPGVTSRWARSSAGSGRASAARTARPAQFRPRLGDLAPEHRDLMTEHPDLGVLGRVAAAQQSSQPKTRIMIR